MPRTRSSQSRPNPMADTARQRIVTGARRHFLSQGFRGVTMDDLATELGMSKRTLYAHFTSKLALVEAVLREKLEAVDADLATISSDASAGFLDSLRELLACVARHSSEIRPAFVRDMRRESPTLFTVVEERRRRLILQHFGRLLARGRRLGRIRRDISNELIVEVLLGAMDAIMNPPKMEELGLTPKSGHAAIISIVLEGVLKGKEGSR